MTAGGKHQSPSGVCAAASGIQGNLFTFRALTRPKKKLRVRTSSPTASFGGRVFVHYFSTFCSEILNLQKMWRNSMKNAHSPFTQFP